jgi:hypothetical protein
VLVLLFPVISASDDLHAMRAEMEESATNKRTVRQAGSDKNSSWVNRLQGFPAALVNAVWLFAPRVELLKVSVVRRFVLSGPSVVHGSRAPPFSLLG